MFAMQVSPCLSLTGIDPQSLATPIRDAVNAGFAKMRVALGVKATYWAELNRDDGKQPFLHPGLWPNPDVRVNCPNNENTNITVWFRPTGAYGPADTDLARQTLTANLSARTLAENFAIRVHDGGMKAFLDIARAYAQQKVDRALKGQPLEGDVHLGDYSITYDNSAKRMTTRMDGWVEGQLTGETTEFWTIFTENLSINWDKASIYCNGTGSFDYGSSVDTVVLSVFNTVLDPIVDALNGDKDLDIDAMVDGQLGGVSGPACQIAPMFPRQYIVPLPLKLVFEYKRLTLANGITAGGVMQLRPRQPAVSLVGPDPVYAASNESPAGVFRARPSDMRPPVTVQWQAVGGVVESPSNATTRIHWNTRIDPGEQTSRTIRVTATDVDGYTRTDQMVVRLRSTADMPDDPLPLPCYHNPDLCDN